MEQRKKGRSRRLNGKHCRVSERADLAEAVISVGLSKTGVTIEVGHAASSANGSSRAQMPADGQRRARHGLCGLRTLDAYIEQGISLWDIAAGWILIETAGGTVEMRPRHRHEGQIQHHRVQWRDRFETLTMIRSGIGYDAHRLAEGRKLILGGIEIPYDRGLDGHSDADVLCHAIADALLGAIGEGDIGHHFPNTDESIRGISSLEIFGSDRCSWQRRTPER